MLTEKEMWEWIEFANWKIDHDHERIGKLFTSSLSILDCIQLFGYIGTCTDALDKKFKKDWLGNPGIQVSDDGWWDLRAEVVGRGEKFYNSITAKKLKQMADNNDYTENFSYCAQIPLPGLGQWWLGEMEGLTKELQKLKIKITLQPGYRNVISYKSLTELLSNTHDLPMYMSIHPLLDKLIANTLNPSTRERKPI
jgi:hypothetical protein